MDYETLKKSILSLKTIYESLEDDIIPKLTDISPVDCDGTKLSVLYEYYLKDSIGTLKACCDTTTDAMVVAQEYSGAGQPQQSQGTSAQTTNVEIQNVGYGDFVSTTIYAQWSSNSNLFYLDDDMTIEYDSGKILYPDGTYKEATLNTMDSVIDVWCEVNNYNYEE